MIFNKLSKYFAWKLPNSEKIDISEFVKVLWNIDIEWDFISTYWSKFWSIKTDYDNLFKAILESENWENKIHKILEYFELSKTFIESIDYSECNILNETKNDLVSIKLELLNEFNLELEELKKSTSNKSNWNKFEELSEKFLLKSSYFEQWFKEFEFEDWTDKIDRLLKLKKDIWNFWKQTNYLWYVILEAKYKKKWWNGSWEVNQLENYIKRLNKYWISKYAIVITSTSYKDTYKIKLWDYCREKVIEQNPFYLSLITTEEIIEFLENKWNYENMSFDDFIDRSFIKWLK